VEVAHQVCILYAVVNGWLNTVAVEKIPEFERRLSELMETRYEAALVSIRETGKLEEATETQLKEALQLLLTEMGG
jgi:F0F1-type ATP synthase alpha subunit